MTLEEINAELLDVNTKLTAKIPEVEKLELLYDRKYYYHLLNSTRASADARQAEARQICIEEGLYEPLMNARIDIRVLYNRRDMLMEYAKNLRIISMNIPDDAILHHL